MTWTIGKGVMWWLGGATLRGYATEDERSDTGPSAAVDGRVITAWREMLVLHTHDKIQYLGYRVPYLHAIKGTRDGWIVVGGSPLRLLTLDAQLHQRRRFDVPPRTSSVFLVDDRHAIAVSETDDGRAHDLYAIDLAHPEARKLAWRATGTVTGYELSTHLLAVNAEDEVQFARVDPRTGAIGEPVRYPVAGPGYAHSVYLLDPARSRGNVALVIADDYKVQTATVVEIRAVTGEVKSRAATRSLPTGST